MPQECRQNRKCSDQSRAKTGANSRNDRKPAYELDGSGNGRPLKTSTEAEMQHLACHGISLRGSGGIIQLFGHPVRKAGNKAVTIGHLNLWQGPRIDDLACFDQFVLRENIRR
jgi:hypothetical protein